MDDSRVAELVAATEALVRQVEGDRRRNVEAIEAMERAARAQATAREAARWEVERQLGAANFVTMRYFAFIVICLYAGVVILTRRVEALSRKIEPPEAPADEAAAE